MVNRKAVWMLAVGGLIGSSGCAGGRAPVRVEPLRDTELMVHMPAPIGRVRLWLPEGIMSERGTASIYPKADAWRWDGAAWRQKAGPDGLFGGGNAGLVDEHTAQCVGIEMPRDSAVTWESRVEPRPDGVKFTIRLTNAGSRPIFKAGAAVCAKLADAAWWRDEHVFVRSGGRWASLAELGRAAGRDDVFEVYLLAGESFENVFYHQFWGVSPHRLDEPVMMAEHAGPNGDPRDTPGCSALQISGERAYFLHSNRLNPCTDIMLAFGDLQPGETRAAEGRLRVTRSAGGATPVAFMGR